MKRQEYQLDMYKLHNTVFKVVFRVFKVILIIRFNEPSEKTDRSRYNPRRIQTDL